MHIYTYTCNVCLCVYIYIYVIRTNPYPAPLSKLAHMPLPTTPCPSLTPTMQSCGQDDDELEATEQLPSLQEPDPDARLQDGMREVTMPAGKCTRFPRLQHLMQKHFCLQPQVLRTLALHLLWLQSLKQWPRSRVQQAAAAQSALVELAS